MHTTSQVPANGVKGGAEMAPSVQDIQDSVASLRAGGMVAYPTETLMALAVDIRNPEAVESLRTTKQRETHKPLAILVASPADVHALVTEVSPRAMRLMEAFWPGPLTLVFNAAPGLAQGITAQTGTVAIRCSSHPVAASLARAMGGAITATGCNRAGGRPAASPDELDPILLGGLGRVLSGAPSPTGWPCTVVDARLAQPTIVREGAIPASAIMKVLEAN